MSDESEKGQISLGVLIKRFSSVRWINLRLSNVSSAKTKPVEAKIAKKKLVDVK